MMRLIQPLIAILGVALGGCSPSVEGPAVDAVTPNWGFNGETTTISVVGENFFPGIDASGTAVVAYDRDFQIKLVGMESRLLSGVRHESSTALGATVPAGIAAGWYGLEVVTPSGRSAFLDDAFEITNTRADNLRLTVDEANVAVNQMAILEFSLRAPDGQVVQESVPLRVAVSNASGSTSDVDFDLSGIVGGTVTSESEATGNLRIDGSGFIGLSSERPAQLWVTVEATVRDRVTVSATRLVTFSAGETDRLLLDLIGAEDRHIAGESIDLSVRLVDDTDNTVSGVTATIALQETCSGGQFETTHTFVDDAILQVVPTKACADNQIRAFGVVEGVAVEGISAPFEVVAAHADSLHVQARPDSVAAGSEVVELVVGAADTFGNPALGPMGEPTVLIDGVEISLASESGDYLCADSSERETRCDVRLFDAHDGRMLEVETTLGLRGTSNPFDVVAGPGFDLSLVMASGTPIAGTPHAVWLTMQDEFGNRLALTETEIDGVAFADSHGPIHCVHTGTALADRTYSYQCTFERSGAGNTIYASSPGLGVMGSLGTFEVNPGRLASVEITRDAAVSVIEAGDTISLALEGFDEMGNRVKGEDTVALANVAGGLISDEPVLIDGVASEMVLVTRAMTGDSVWATRGLEVLGGTSAFTVQPAAASTLFIEPNRYWGFVGEPIAVRLAVTDEFGNATGHPGGEVSFESSLDGSSPQHRPWTPGEELEYVPGRAIVGDTLSVRLDGMSTTLEPIDVGLRCGEFTEPPMASTGPEGRLCVLDEELIEVEHGEPTATLIAAQSNTGLPVRGTGPSVALPVSETQDGTVHTFAVRADGCAAEGEIPFWAGPPGEAVGPINIASSDAALTGGTGSDLSRTDLLIQAKTCTGDPASETEVHLTTSAGILRGDGESAFGPTGFGHALTIGTDGFAGVELSVESFLFGGDIVIRSSSERAFGTVTVPVLGDSVPPRVRFVTPRGRHLAPIETITIAFTESMLMDPLAVVADEWIRVEADGVSVPIEGVEFRDAQTIDVSLPIDAFETATVHLTDAFRDTSGNRLDGDSDGVPGGAWTTGVGIVADEAPSATECSISVPRFRPDGDDGAHMEADRVRVEVQFTDDAESIQWSIIGEDGTWFETKDLAIGRSDGASVEWNGRDAGGQIVPSGIYTIEVVSIDEMGSIGAGCAVSVEVATDWFDGGE